MYFKFLSFKKGHGYVMLFTVLLLALFQVTLARQLQQQVKLSGRTLPVRAILDEIQQQSNFRFVYTKKFAAVDKVVTVRQQADVIENIFAQVNAQTGLTFIHSGNQVIVKEKGTGNIRGSVRTIDGKPAAFVTVNIKNITGAIVDESGNFTLKNIPAGSYTLTASLIGLETQTAQVTVTANETAAIDLTLRETSQQLNEVVVSGQKKNKFAVKESDYIARLPITNLENPQVYNVVTNAVIK